MTITTGQLAQATGAGVGTAQRWLPLLAAAMAEFGIDTPVRQAAFLAQIGIESLHLMRVAENMNYSVDALMIFGHRFTDEERAQYGRSDQHPADQRRIANIAYANRFGNGDRTSNDGWDFRGGGLGMLTFRDNYRALERDTGILFTQTPRRIEEPILAARSAAWYWRRFNCNRLADRGDFDGVSRLINGGDHALDRRRALTLTALEAFHAGTAIG